MAKLRDTAFCGSDCVNTTCTRYFGEREKVKAGAWWKQDRDGKYPPSWPLLAFADFSGECDLYKAPEKAS